MESIVETIFARRAGFRYAAHVTIWPSRTRRGPAASAASEVKHSNVSSSVGSRVGWKWSASHTDSKPRASARAAISALRRHAFAADQPEYSPVQPWGMMIPTRTRSSNREVVEGSSGSSARRGRGPAVILVAPRLQRLDTPDGDDGQGGDGRAAMPVKSSAPRVRAWFSSTREAALVDRRPRRAG